MTRVMTRYAAGPVLPADPRQRPTIAFVLKGYPRLSETFIAQEIKGLEDLGYRLLIVSLRLPTDRTRHPIVDAIRAPVWYLPEYLYQAPLLVLKSWWRARRLPGYRQARAAWLRDLLRDPTPNRGRRWGQALVLAAGLPPEVHRLHAHFIHTPGSVARYAALVRGVPLSLSAHAKDIWTIPDWEKREKLAAAEWTVTCTASGAEHLRSLSPAADRVALVYHGLDFTRFPDPGPVAEAADGDGVVRLLTIGRLVEKKGFDDLLAALAQVEQQGLRWRLTHIGGGNRQPLADLAARLGIAGRIEWRGAQPQSEILAALRSADLFVLASRIAGDGDRDGLPNVLMEAQSQRLPVLSTAVSAIPELIRHGETGWLVPPGDPAALAGALATLIADPALRRRLGEAGFARVRAAFSHDAGLADLARRFGPPNAAF